MNIISHPYHDGEKDYLWHAYENAMKSHIDKLWGWDPLWQKDNFDKSLIEYQTSILKIANERIGYLQFKCNAESIFISMLVLEPEYQSKGYGNEILKNVQLVEPNSSLVLRCFQVNKLAYRFYLREGFEVTGTDDNFITMCRRKIA